MPVSVSDVGESASTKRAHRRAHYRLNPTMLLLLNVAGALVPSAWAAPLVLPRDAARTVDLGTFNNKTYLQAVLEPGDGINAKTVADDSTGITIAGTAAILSAFSTFDPATAQHLYFHFNNGQADFTSAAGHLAGQNLSPQQIQNALQPYLVNVKPGDALAAKVAASDLILLASGSGTVVQITTDDYFYNVAYQPPDWHSGRSYAVTASRSLLDASDNYYLTELGNLLTASSEQQISDFYQALFKILTACDVSGVSGLTPAGQTVLCDFFAVYTAETMRHNMTNNNVNALAYDVDIAQVTLLSAYISASGQVLDGGKLIAGNPTAYSAAGHSIGTHEADFRKLAKLITAFENGKKQHRAMVKAVKSAAPVKGAAVKSAVSGDVFRQALVFLDQPQFEAQAQANAAALTTAMVQLLAQIRSDQTQITAYVLAHQ